VSCKDEGGSRSTKPQPTKAAPAKTAGLTGVGRSDFNRVAALLSLPVFWVEDRDKDGALDPDELATLHGFGTLQPGADLASTVHKAISERLSKPPSAGAEEEKKRRDLVEQELAQGRPTLVAHDFSSASAQDKAILRHLIKAAELIEVIYARQTGAHELSTRVAKDDLASQMLFYRNQGPWCVAPKTESDPACSAIPGTPKKLSGIYPKGIQEDGFCEKLAKDPKKAKLLLDHFSILMEKDGKLVGAPYHEVYKTEMVAISKELRSAADAIQGDAEAAFKAYLLATSQAFLDNQWDPANEAWSKMNVHNSKWYLRIGPDEVYFEPCSQKAGFHVSFGLIDQGSLEWQKKLDPIKGDMEKALAERAGAPYQAREVSFHLPDFVDIVLNAGDSRSPHGATIGQSLPNWGPVANEGRGRTVAMTNFYSDPDSIKTNRAQAESLLCKDSMAHYVADPGPQLMSTVLHEAAHNLGPAHEYKVKGKTDDEAFGGPLASTMEELKAQTAALFFTDWLVDKKVISRDDAHQAHTRDLLWGFGHISRGMYSSSGKPKPYSQLAAIQLRFLMKEGVVSWKNDTLAANGSDKGCFALELERFPPAISKMMSVVAGIKARGDKAGAQALVQEFVDKDDESKKVLEVIKDRVLRAPKASFVYSIKL
jgi:hypothetical protein